MWYRSAAAVAVALAVVLAGCGQGQSRRERVTLRLTWTLKGEHAPLLVAREKGYFAAEGLDVAIAEGAGVQAALAAVGTGKDVVAYGSATAAVMAIDKGMPLKVVAVYGRVVPWAIVSMPEIPLHSPADLEGRTLAAANQGTFATLLKGAAGRMGVTLQRLQIIEMDEGAKAAQFLQRKVDLAAVYTNEQLPVWEKKAGMRLNVLPLADHGLRLPGTALIAATESVRTRKDLLQRIHRGILNGFEFCLQEPSECARIAAGAMPNTGDEEVLRRQLEETLALLPAEPGILPESDWAEALAFLHDAGLISQVESPSHYHAGLAANP